MDCSHVTPMHNYGFFRRNDNNYYKVIDEGSDWLLIKIKGKVIYVFKWVFEE